MGSFVKWAGGKGQLIDRIGMRVPNEFGTYFEPFVGSGALLFGLKPQNAVINDINEQLINCYRWLQTEPREIIKAIKKIEETPCNEDYYYQMRDKYNNKILNNELDVECAGLMIWINKHCFNGLYRVNSNGLFNVPYNNNSLARVIDENNIISIGNYLSNNNIRIENLDFETVCNDVVENDFVYFDSPYVPLTQTASFTDYTKDGFCEEDHRRLARLFRELDQSGAFVMLSNNDVPLVRELYDGYFIETVNVRRSINRNAQDRNSTEIIITNYDTGMIN